MSPPALPAVPKNAPEFATMVSNNPEAWFDFVKQMLDKHRALEQDLFNTRQELEIVKQELGESQKAQEQQLAVAAELRTLLAAANATAYSSANLHYANRPRSKLDVPEFSGVKKDYAEFKAQLQIKLVTDSAEYQDEQTACAYIISKLKGPAFHQVYPRIKDGRYTGQTAVELIKLLDLIYEDPHRQETATREIMALRQKNRPFSDFMADFRTEMSTNKATYKQSNLASIFTNKATSLTSQTRQLEFRLKLLQVVKLPRFMVTWLISPQFPTRVDAGNHGKRGQVEL